MDDNTCQEESGSGPGAIPRTGAEKMRRTLYLLVLLVVGCQGVSRPRERASPPPRPDNPALPTEEQRRIGRDILAVPEQSPTLVPRAYSDFLGPHRTDPSR